MVMLTDCPDMTLNVYRERKTTLLFRYFVEDIMGKLRRHCFETKFYICLKKKNGLESLIPNFFKQCIHCLAKMLNSFNEILRSSIVSA